MDPSLVIASSVPGRRVGANTFTGVQTFASDHFTPDELKTIAADRAITVVVGKVLVAGEVDEFLAALRETKAAHAAAKTKEKATK